MYANSLASPAPPELGDRAPSGTAGCWPGMAQGAARARAAQSLQRHLWITAALCSEGTGCGHAGKALGSKEQALQEPRHSRDVCTYPHRPTQTCSAHGEQQPSSARHEVMWHSAAHCYGQSRATGLGAAAARGDGHSAVPGAQSSPSSPCRGGFLPSVGAARKLGELRSVVLIVSASEFN